MPLDFLPGFGDSYALAFVTIDGGSPAAHAAAARDYRCGMTDGRCPVCAAATDSSDRFCAACGVRLDAPVVFDAERAPVHVVDSGSRSRIAALLVPLGVVAVLVVGGLALLGGGDEEDPDDPAAAAEPTPSVARPSPTEPAASPTSRPTPRPTSTPTPAPPPSVPDIAPADLSAVPETEATHVLLTHGRDLVYLELATGAWTVHEGVGLLNGPPRTAVIPFGRGAVVNLDRGATYVPVDDRPRPLADGWAMGAANDLVYIQSFGRLERNSVLLFDDAGAVVDTIELPDQTWGQWILPTGEIVVQGGGRVFLRGPDAVTVVTEGTVLSVVDDHLLVHGCDDALVCGYRLVDLIGGSEITLEDLTDTGFPELIDRRTIIVHGAQEAVLHQIEGSRLVVVDDELSFRDAKKLALGSAQAATDATGLHAVIEGDRLLFHGPTGDPFTRVELDQLGGFGDWHVRFITVADAG